MNRPELADVDASVLDVASTTTGLAPISRIASRPSPPRISGMTTTELRACCVSKMR